MILYFADRDFNILGQASTHLPRGLTVIKDKKTEDVSLGSAIFECTLTYDSDTMTDVADFSEVGNYLLRSNGEENELYTIIETEKDTKKHEIYVYAEDAGMDLLNEVVGAYEADKAYPIEHYITKFAAGSGFKIGINEVESLTKQLSWDGEQTAMERLLSIATGFDDCEISFSFDVRGLDFIRKYINVYSKRGQELGIQLRLNKEVDSIVTTKSISNLATALYCIGGIPDNSNEHITLEGYVYDDGNFYVSGNSVVSRNALEKWGRLLWQTDSKEERGGHITKQFSYDTLSKSELCSRAIAELKTCCDAEINYEADITELPDNVHVGDRVNIIDDAGGLYLSTRLLVIETSVSDNTRRATLGENLIKKDGISAKVERLAAEFAANAQSASRALMIANNAKTAADTAQEQATAAVESAATAQTAADTAAASANNALQSAQEAQTAAAAAQSAVATVTEEVTALETTVDNAKKAADNAQAAATTAQNKADEAATAAANAQSAAEAAQTAANGAQSTADTAVTNAAAAKTAADEAKSQATAASTTAAAAKADAEAAQADIDQLGEDLTTLSNTMSADYARKTDLTEATSSLQTQITQNADTIATHATQITTIDETANNAASQAAAAQTAAAAAQSKADAAAADAGKAQEDADAAAAAATTAQNEANAAKTAAANAKSVADAAAADLETAKTNLATVTSRVDATEEDIAAAQAAVEAAQTAADAAQADATAAAEKATTAQTAANTAADNAAAAQTAANDAANKATLAQAAADEAKGTAAAAQTKANEAAEAAAAAQTTANTAKTNAATAQAAADKAKADAATAQAAADAADAKAAQAATDLATAQQNLVDVTSRVDATEEEVAAAQAAVVTAQEAADAADAAAKAAQSTADTAKTNAANAQTAANNAKTAADNAQAAADAAKDAADAARADVYALAARVTTAETSITQNAEQIELRATKTEVTETLGGYYTKEEADSALEMSAEEIRTEVSETYATNNELTNAKTLISQLSDMISSIISVEDENGTRTSAMTQTEDGWTFDITKLLTSVNELSEMIGYVAITTYEGNPCIELGKKGSRFKVRITNTTIQFLDGDVAPASISNQMLNIKKAVVEDELQFGGFAFKERDNGNMGLVWVG